MPLAFKSLVDVKLCIHCKYSDYENTVYSCTHASNCLGISPVTGHEIYNKSCDEMRADESLCGLAARYFEIHSVFKPKDTITLTKVEQKKLSKITISDI